MNPPPVFLTVELALAIHRRLIREFGGDPGLRDRGLLESAVLMPAARFGGHLLHEGLPALAAAYLFHLCRNHAFVDGNKRVALAAAELFLDLNGRRLVASEQELEDLVSGVAAGVIGKEEVTAFFRRAVARGGDKPEGGGE